MGNWFFVTTAAILMFFLAAPRAARAQQAPPPDDRAPNSHRDRRNELSTAPDRSYSVGELLAYAARHSPDLAVVNAEQARWRAEQVATSPLFPADLRVSGGLGRRTTRAGAGWDYVAGLSQQIEIAGQRAARRRAARAGTRLGQAELERSRALLQARVRGTFNSALVARERKLVADRFARFASKLVTIAERRLAAGETSQIPLRLAEAERANAHQEALRAAGQFREECLLLAELVGWQHADPPVPAGPLPAPRRSRSAAELARLAQTNPDLRVRAERVNWARSKLAAANREAWPNPELGAQYTREAGAGAGNSANIWQGTVTIPLPIWGANRPERARAEAELDIAKAEQAARRRTLPVRVARSVLAATTSAERVSTFGADIVPNLQRTLLSSERAFDLGEIDITDVMLAREQLLRAELAMLDAYADYYRAAADLELELGRNVHAIP